MNLRQVIAEQDAVGAVPDVDITGLDYDSRRIESGFAFFAFPGEQVDGHRFIPGGDAGRRGGCG